MLHTFILIFVITNALTMQDSFLPFPHIHRLVPSQMCYNRIHQLNTLLRESKNVVSNNKILTECN